MGKRRVSGKCIRDKLGNGIRVMQRAFCSIIVFHQVDTNCQERAVWIGKSGYF